MRYQRAELLLKLDGLAAAREFFAGCFAGSDPSSEALWVAHVDRQSRCLHLSRHAGDETGANFPIGAIIADAAQLGSGGIVLAHNHPSGNPKPSNSDKQITQKLQTGAKALDMQLVDHIIIADRLAFSFADEGLL